MGTDAPRSRRRHSLTPGVLVLVLCALVAATFDGPRWTTAEQREDRPAAGQHERRGDRADDATAQQSQQGGGDDDHWLPWAPATDLLLLVPAALVFGIAVAVAARLRLVRRRRRLTGRIGARRTPMPVPEPAPQEEAGLTEALDASARVLGEGTPRNAIVAAWVLLEQAVENERFPHRPEETPSELVERVVSSYRLDGEAIGRLAALYREARFSTHPVTEEHRTEAADCLRRLLTSLRVGAR